MEAVITYYGNAVRTATLKPNDSKLDIYGFLIRFTYRSKKYKYYKISDFRVDDSYSEEFVVPGYYMINDFDNHLANPGPGEYSLQELLKKRFTEDRFAKISVGDIVTVKRLDQDYIDGFYRQQTYTFPHQTVNEYILNGKLNTAIMGTSTDITIDGDDLAEDFFNHNIQHVNDYNNSDYEFSLIIVQIAIVISMIRRYIFPILKDTTSGTDLTLVSAYIIDIELELQAKIFGEDGKEDALEFLNLLVSMYKSVDRNKKTILSSTIADDRLYLICKIFSKSTLESLVSTDIKIKILNSLIDQKNSLGIDELSEIDQRFMASIVKSISVTDADMFLQYYLLPMKDGEKTKYEILYRMCSDESYIALGTFKNFFEEEKSNRHAFVLAVYRLWQSSYYSFYHIPSNITPIDGSINPNCFFLNQGAHYFADVDLNPTNPSVLEFVSVVDSTLVVKKNTKKSKRKKKKNWRISEKSINITYKAPNITGITIPINRVYDMSEIIRKYKNPEIVKDGDDEHTDEPYGNYHIYQPIIITGYQTTLTRPIIPNNHETIPAFLYHYSEDVIRIKGIYALVDFSIEIALEVGLFFTTGGLGNLRHLKHLRHINKIGRAFRVSPTYNPDTAIKIWKGIEGASEAFTLTTSAAHATSNYIANKTNDLQLKEIASEVGNIMLLLSFFGGANAFVSNQAAFKSAKKIDSKLTQLSIADIPHELDGEVINMISHILGQEAVALSLFKNKFTNALGLPDGSISNIANKFDDLDPATQFDFYVDFKGLNKSADWKKLNANGNYIDNWETLYAYGASDRMVIDIITDQALVDKMIPLVSRPNILLGMESISLEKRLRFIDDYGDASTDIINRLDENPSVIVYWSKYSEAEMDIAKNNPTKFLDDEIHNVRLDRAYVHKGNKPLMTTTEVFDKFKQDGLDLFNQAEQKVNEIYDAVPPPSGNYLRQRQILCFMTDLSEPGDDAVHFFNYTHKEVDSDEAYHIWFNNHGPDANTTIDYVNPNVKKRMKLLLERKKGEGINNETPDLGYAGNFLGMHAEVRSLNKLACNKFGNVIQDDAVFDAWIKNSVLGYNRRIVPNSLQKHMFTCVDCFYLVDLVTFIR